MGISTNTINEDLIMVLKGLMGDKNSQVIDTLKDRLITYLESKLDMDSFEKEVLKQSILELEEDEFPQVFSDKRFLARIITDTFIREFGEKYLNGLTNMTRELLMNRIDNEDFKRELEDKFTIALDSLLDSIESNMDSKLKGIRDSVLS